MILKKSLAFLASISLLSSNPTYVANNVFANNYTTDISINKISEELAVQIKNYEYDSFPVILWFDGINEEEVELQIKNKIGYNLSSIEEKYSTPSNELIDELSVAANNDASEHLKLLMQNHLKSTEKSRFLENEKTNLYSNTRKQIIKNILEQKSKSIISKSAVSYEDVGFISAYAPMIVVSLSSQEIKEISELEEIQEISLYTPLEIEECTVNFGTTKATVGINEINELIGLTGEGVNIGIYETCTVSPSYYTENGLSASDITIVGASYNTGSDHSTYCAGIAAGSTGIAPNAHIYSASCENDWNNFEWNDYENAQLSTLEQLISNNVDLVSISWGSTNDSSCYNYWAKYIDSLISSTNTTIICATGNDENEYIINPSSAYNCIAVNGFIDNYRTNHNNILNDYSYNNGNGCLKPDIVGPSLNNGTSTATPYIAGMIALMYQYKPSLAVMPEVTKAILLASCHEKCSQILRGNSISSINASMTSGLNDKQGAGIPNMYKMISIVSQHTYGNGILSSSNNYQREVHFVQPKYNSNYINISMAYLQTDVPSSNTSGTLNDYDIEITNNGTTQISNKANSSTELVYKELSSNNNYLLNIYKYSGNNEAVRYAYAWSTDKGRFYNNYDNEGIFYFKNYKSSYYLSRNTSDNKSNQTSFNNSLDLLWIIQKSATNNTYEIKNANIQSNGLGMGTTIGTNNYYALEGNSSNVHPINISFDSETGTYSFTQVVNGTIYALGINKNSNTSGSYANWYPYSVNNQSQKWYLERANYYLGDVNIDSVIDNNDSQLVQQFIVQSTNLNNLQKYLSDVNNDNIIDIADAIIIQQYD